MALEPDPLVFPFAGDITLRRKANIALAARMEVMHEELMTVGTSHSCRNPLAMLTFVKPFFR
jgi:hypothetical protein